MPPEANKEQLVVERKMRKDHEKGVLALLTANGARSGGIIRTAAAAISLYRKQLR